MKNLYSLFGLLLLVGCGAPDLSDSGTLASSGTEESGNFTPELSKNAAGEVAARVLNAPATMAGPSNFNGVPVSPRVAPTFQGPIPTSDWWTSLLWPYYPGNNFGESLFAHPLVFKANTDGLALSYPNQSQVSGDGVNYSFHFREDLRVGTVGLSAPDVKVANHSDWTVTAQWSGGSNLRATVGHGLPFAYFQMTGAPAQVRTSATPQVFYDQDGTLGMTVNGHNYGVFAPTGSRWVRSGSVWTNDLAGRDYVSVALLPDNTPATLQRFRQSAFTFVTGSKVAWNVSGSTVKTTYDLQTETKEGAAGKPLMALYRHQWLHSPGPFTGDTYVSPRGQMKVVHGNSFDTTMTYTGVLPNLPLTGKADNAKLRALVERIYQEQLPRPLPNKDVYFAGKDLTRLAALVPIAEQVQHLAARDLFLKRIRERLDDFFDGSLPNAFFYNPTWTTLIAQPAGFGSDTQLNDHHFHFGYYIMAAATLARYDKAWAARNVENVEELIADAGNGDRANLRYPFLRCFDPYAGHSWANGGQVFASGNNQESTSESMHFASAVILWAQEMQRPALRDLGIYLYTTEAESIWQYWFDADRAVFPTTFPHAVLGILWGNGGAYATWWTANREEIHGINFLPIHGGSLYLGRRPDALARNLNHMVQQNGGPATVWQDILWSAKVFVDGQKSLDEYLAANPAPEGGETAAHTYHWLANLAGLGRQDNAVGADVPCFAVLNDGTQRSYMAYNSSTQPVTARFTDGVTLSVPAGTVAFKRAPIGSNPTPTDPSPSPSPTQTPPPPAPGTSVGKLWLSTGGQMLPAGGSESSLWVASAGGQNYDGKPHLAETFVATGLTGTYSGGATQFDLGVDADRSIGVGTQVRVSYDFTGDGSSDRVETYRYFATDPIPGRERYRATQGLLSASGAPLQDMRGGSMRVEVWNAIGNGPVSLGLGTSWVEAPFSGSSSPSPSPSPTAAPASKFDLFLGAGLQADAPVPSVLTLASAGGVNRDGRPGAAAVLESPALTGRYNGQSPRFQLRVDGGTKIATAVQMRVSYDWTGDGSFDRVETWRYFPNDPRVGWENYRETQGLLSATGAWANFQGGKVRVELWSALGNDPTQVELGSGSQLTLPFTP